MNSNVLRRRLEALREQKVRIDLAIEQLEAQIEAQEQAEKRGALVLEVEPARGGGSYVLQKVLCGKPSCRYSRPGGELHGPYWYDYCKKDGKTKSKYMGKNRTAGARIGCLMCLWLMSHSILAHKHPGSLSGSGMRFLH